MHHPKIILLRGNSGSGKTTVAKTLQEKLGRGTLYISQDHVRRNMLYARGGADRKSIELLKHLVLFGSQHCDVTILDGILYANEHEELFTHIKALFREQTFTYYFDLPFEETLRRHEQKRKVKYHSFGETEMRKWWREKDFAANLDEKIITQDMHLETIIERIHQDIQSFPRA
ncbi:MAG: AAA family ATPase [Oscillospiraceae bacterium]|nr:AAA family ATPase [Oscillospiraceae bacterium]